MNIRRAVGALILSEGKVVLVHKISNSDGSPINPYWGLPVGGVEDGEDEKAAVVREASEETGLLLTDPEGPVGVFEYRLPPEVTAISGFDGQRVTVYKFELKGQPIVRGDGEEIGEASWHTPKEVLAKVESMPETHEFLLEALQ